MPAPPPPPADASSKPNGHSSSSGYKKVLTRDSINANVLNVSYAVRGEISNRANDYASRIAKAKGKAKDLPFDSVVTANIGNPQQQPYLAQKPLTFWRQVAALTELPQLLDVPGLCEGEGSSSSSSSSKPYFPSDVVARAKSILEDVGSVGAYSHSKGAESIRRHVAEFIEARDGGHASDPELIYLTSGASGGVSLLMSILIANPNVGVAIPIPQYPLYSATLSLYDAKPVRYELDAEDDWALDVDALERSIDKAQAEGTDVRALVVINPGNPTGSCLTEQNIRDVIRLAHRKRLLLLADEVYQANIYQPDERPFVSFKKVLRSFAESEGGEEGKRIAEETELVSFHSISKGFTGECGRRGGYFELTNIDADVQAEIYKMASVSLCPSLQGQIGVDLLVKPPVEGEPSYPLYAQERDQILQTLHERSDKMSRKFNDLPGVQCAPAQGALYLLPRIALPKKAHEAAEKQGRKPDEFYCLAMLDATGICVVPGSGFGMAPREDGSIFFRTTVLAKETDEFVNRFEKFQKEFLEEYQ